MSATAGLEPRDVWQHFEHLCRIPRSSGKEGAAARHVAALARRLGLWAVRDKAGNVLVRKPASPGREAAPSVCLQAHLDMVCVAADGRTHDFAKQPITLVLKRGRLQADGTSLGADNGIGVAVALALMTRQDLVHGPLELLFTVDEESGLTGANGLPRGLLRSRALLNLDSEELDTICVGCAGGHDCLGTWKLEVQPVAPGSVPMELVVRGLSGGHSGVEIHHRRANAIKLLVEALGPVLELGATPAGLNGGDKRNVIPTHAEAVLFAPRRALPEARRLVMALERRFRARHRKTDPKLRVRLRKPKVVPQHALGARLTRQVLRAIKDLPHGVIAMDPDIRGLVETSMNVAVLRTDAKAKKVTLETSQRSMRKPELLRLAQRAAAILARHGARTSSGVGYSPWRTERTSPLLAIATRTYRQVLGEKPKIIAIHAGLECGVIGEKYPAMDMVSIGPDVTDVHTPEETLFVKSVPEFWRYLVSLLEQLA